MSGHKKNIFISDRGGSRQSGILDVDTKKRELVALFFLFLIECIQYLSKFSSGDILIRFK